MKTKNDLKTGILIGIGMIVVPILLMSTTYVTNKESKFEIHDNGTILLNSETGDMWYIWEGNGQKKNISSENKQVYLKIPYIEHNQPNWVNDLDKK